MEFAKEMKTWDLEDLQSAYLWRTSNKGNWGANQMDQKVKTLATQAWWPEFDLHKDIHHAMPWPPGLVNRQ